jgi:hypothetical protein
LRSRPTAENGSERCVAAPKPQVNEDGDVASASAEGEVVYAEPRFASAPAIVELVVHHDDLRARDGHILARIMRALLQLRPLLHYNAAVPAAGGTQAGLGCFAQAT